MFRQPQNEPKQSSLVMRKLEELGKSLSVLDKRVDEFQDRVSGTNSNFGARLGKLEAREEVRDEQYKHVRERLDEISKDMETFQKESKNSIAELRGEHKASMEELRKGNKDILDAVTPLKHDVDELNRLKADVKELKERDGKTWQDVKGQAFKFVIGIILVIIAAALGLKEFL